jgi:GMP synthase-like glutamine amidotransferase
MRVIVIRHHAEDAPGFIADAFTARGATLATYLFPGADALPDPAGADHVVVLGALPSVYDDGADRDWIAQELAWLRWVDAAGVPVLGICFGAQALCAALGGRVAAAPRREIGWTLIESADPELIPMGPWLQFHGDQCLPPPGAMILARNETCVQAFLLGRHLAVQFHPEVDGEQLSQWLDASARDQVRQAGQDPDVLIAETIAHEPAARSRAGLLVGSALRLGDGRGSARELLDPGMQPGGVAL